MKTSYILALTAAFQIPMGGALAQNTTSAAVDWSGNYSFSSTSQKLFRLQQADLLKKEEEGYYESIGKINQNYNVNNNVAYDQSTNIGEILNDNSTEIGQNTNAVGAINNSTTNIDVSGDGNGSVTAVNAADSIGCQDGSISTIDISSESSSRSGSGSSSCN